MTRHLTRSVLLVGIAFSIGCGSKSGLQVPEARRDAGVDARMVFDAGTDASQAPDRCIQLPFLDPPSFLDIEFTAQILSADVFFLVDVTGSMGEEINQIRLQIREEIIPGLAAEIPDVRFGIGYFADFPLPELNYGELSDEVFRLLLAESRDLGAVQAAVDRLPMQGGLDGPEAMIEALYLTASGEGLGRFVSARSCPLNTVGYPCFREQGSRIVLAFTDAPSHNGPGGHDAYSSITPAPHTYEEAVNQLRAIGAKVIGLYSGGADGLGELDLVALARDTDAVRAGGSPLVFDIGRDGRFLSTSVIEGVRSLVEEVPIDVDVLVEDMEGDTLDATRFVVEIVAERAEPTEGAVNAGDRFIDVHPGTRVFFRIVLANELIPQTDVAQRFLLRVVLRGDGVTRLQETIVEIVIPPIGGGTVCGT